MKICTHCHGTGQHGNCEYCGGSGFNPQEAKGITPVSRKSRAKIIEEFRRKEKAKAMAKERAKTKAQRVRHPSMDASKAICGLTWDQLEIPVNGQGFQLRKIRSRVKSIVFSMPDVTRIVWTHTLNNCIAHGPNGKIREFLFEPEKQPEKKCKQISPSKISVEQSKRKQRPLTIPHPSQVALVPKKIPATTCGELWVRIKHHGKRTVKNNQTGLLRSEASPMKPTSLEIALKAARNHNEIDGSKDWSQYRDVDGRFGSHPTFDPSDTPDD
jgi:hypothetical protein